MVCPVRARNSSKVSICSGAEPAMNSRMCAQAWRLRDGSLRFPGPETMETKIFARLSAWQNWIFQLPNATGPEGALKLYGTGKQSKYDRKRA